MAKPLERAKLSANAVVVWNTVSALVSEGDPNPSLKNIGRRAKIVRGNVSTYLGELREFQVIDMIDGTTGTLRLLKKPGAKLFERDRKPVAKEVSGNFRLVERDVLTGFPNKLPTVGKRETFRHAAAGALFLARCGYWENEGRLIHYVQTSTTPELWKAQVMNKERRMLVELEVSLA